MNFDTIGASGVLSSSNVQDLIREGHDLDQDKTYLLKFAFNDKLNEAVDPMPFQIATSALDKVAESGIGRPYVHNPGIPNNKGEHVRGPVDDPKQIVEFQKKYAIGLIEKYIKNPNTNNVYYLISAFPEYVDDITSGKIPVATSPLIEPLDMKGNLIKDGNVLHLQAVTVGGYGQLARKLGVCKGMLDECSTQLKTLGSSGKLKEFQKNFYYTLTTLGASEMPLPDQATEGPDGTGAMNVNDMVKKHDQILGDHSKQLGAMGDMLKQHGESLGSIGSKLDDVVKAVTDKKDDNYGGNTDGAEGSLPPPGTGAKPQSQQSQSKKFDSLGSAGQELIQMKKELDNVKAQLEKTKQDEALREREQMAKTIVNGEVILKEITPDKYNERVQQYIDLKDESKNPVDLSLLAQKYGKLTKTLGSSGNDDFDERFPGLDTLGASGPTTDKKSALDVMLEIE